MAKRKTVTIPMELWDDLIRYFILQDADPDLEVDIVKEIEGKIDRMVLHELYTQYHTADTAEEREKARKEYLDRIGMRQSFRW